MKPRRPTFDRSQNNLADVLPKPYVELGIQISRGAAEFLRKDLTDAIKEAKDEKLLAIRHCESQSDCRSKRLRELA